MGKRKAIFAGLSLLLLAALTILFIGSQRKVKIYDKNFELLDVEYNYVNVYSDEHFRNSMASLL